MRQGRSGRAPLVIFKREHNQLWATTHPPAGNEIRGGAHNALGTTRVRGTVLRDLGWLERERALFLKPKNSSCSLCLFDVNDRIICLKFTI